MKTTNYFIMALFIGAISWSCTSETNSSLKSQLDQNASTLNAALNTITSSEGYQVLSTSGTETTAGKSNVSPLVIDSTFNSILLTDIVGEYEFNKANTYKKWKQPITNFFSKSADNATQMIVRLPEEKVKKSNSLFIYNPADTLLTNNYVFSLNKYDYKFNRFLGWNYQMASTIQIKSVDAGALSIQSSSSKTEGYKFASQFLFANGYSTNCSYSSGDTAVAVYAVLQANKILFEEKFTAIKSLTDKRHREKEYSLTIGDVKIIRTLGKNSLDSAKIYLNNVLQSSAKVAIVDIASIDGTDISVTSKKRELKITFDDGTSKTISQLLGTSVESIRNLFISLRQSYFATNIVDRIAWNIYVSKK